MNKFQIGQKVTSTYQGITGVVISHEPPFMDHASIGVEYQALMLGKAVKYVTVSRSFLERDFSAAQQEQGIIMTPKHTLTKDVGQQQTGERK